MKIYLDFDGTVVEHDYPKMGRCNYGCFEIIKKLQDAGHEIILNTYRSELDSKSLSDALTMINNRAYMFIKDRGKRDEFNLDPMKSTEKKIHPWPWDLDYYLSQKIAFIDDTSTGVPLKKACMANGKMVDWGEVDRQFEQKGFYNKQK